MKVTLTLEMDGNSVSTSFISDGSKQDFLTLADKSFDVLAATKYGDRELVLLGLKRDNIISYIRAVREGTDMYLKEAKDAVELALKNQNSLLVPKSHWEAVVKACNQANLPAGIMTSEERICFNVHDS